MSPPVPVNPASLAPPRGYSHGMKGAGEVLFVSGQVGWDGQGRMVAGGFVAQFAQALGNVLAVVRAAGGAPEDLAKMTIYVTDLDAYRSSTRAIGAAWRARLGKHFPAMALVGVAGLVERRALVEIEAVAALGDDAASGEPR